MEFAPIEDVLRLRIMSKAYRKIFYYINATPNEVSGFGKVKIKGSNFDVTDVRIFRQNSSGGGTTIKADTLAKFLSLLARKGEKLQDWKLWWHSHPSFDTYFSNIDTKTIAELSNGSMLVSLCINQFGDMKARKDGIGGHRRLEIVVIPNETDSLKQNCVKEVKRKVKEEVIPFVPFTNIWPFYKTAWPAADGIITV